MAKTKVIKVSAPEDRRYGHTTGTIWDAGYTVLFDTPYVKYISIDFLDGIEIIVSKIIHPFGVRYYVSVPWKMVSTSMLVSLTNTSDTIFHLLHKRGVGFMCKQGNEFAKVCHQQIKLLQAEETLTIAEVLRDLGDF